MWQWWRGRGESQRFFTTRVLDIWVLLSPIQFTLTGLCWLKHLLWADSEGKTRPVGYQIGELIPFLCCQLCKNQGIAYQRLINNASSFKCLRNRNERSLPHLVVCATTTIAFLSELHNKAEANFSPYPGQGTHRKMKHGME